MMPQCKDASNQLHLIRQDALDPQRLGTMLLQCIPDAQHAKKQVMREWITVGEDDSREGTCVP